MLSKMEGTLLPSKTLIIKWRVGSIHHLCLVWTIRTHWGRWCIEIHLFSCFPSSEWGYFFFFINVGGGRDGEAPTHGVREVSVSHPGGIFYYSLPPCIWLCVHGWPVFTGWVHLASMFVVYLWLCRFIVYGWLVCGWLFQHLLLLDFCHIYIMCLGSWHKHFCHICHLNLFFSLIVSNATSVTGCLSVKLYRLGGFGVNSLA